MLICGAGPIGLVNLITAKDNIACKILVKIEADRQVLDKCTKVYNLAEIMIKAPLCNHVLENMFVFFVLAGGSISLMVFKVKLKYGLNLKQN